MSAKLVQVGASRLVAVRAALQRSVLSRQGSATVHLRCAFVHDRTVPTLEDLPCEEI